MRSFRSSPVSWQRRQKGVLRIFRDGDLCIHETALGYFAYREPYIRLDMHWFDELARANFSCGCTLGPGDVIVDIGAGAGEETLTFSGAIGPTGKVISIESRPRTYHCLKALVRVQQPAECGCLTQGDY